MSPADIFPSIYLQPDKIVELLTWWLNPLEKPPQKFLSLSQKEKTHDIFMDLLNQEGFETHSAVVADFDLSQLETLGLKFNLVYSLEWHVDKIRHNRDRYIHLFRSLHEILKASSYLILEIKFNSEEEIDLLEELLLDSGFGSITVLVPHASGKTNPFSPVDFLIHKHCWLSALSKQTDEDPIEWLNEYFDS